MKDKHTHGKKVARNGCITVIRVTFFSDQSLVLGITVKFDQKMADCSQLILTLLKGCVPFETSICLNCQHQNEPTIIEKFAKLKIEMFDEEGPDRKKVSATTVVPYGILGKNLHNMNSAHSTHHLGINYYVKGA